MATCTRPTDQNKKNIKVEWEASCEEGVPAGVGD